jgi:phage-related minor tail protein
MDDVVEELVVAVRADTQSFSRDVDAMRGALDNGLGDGFARAGRSIEQGLLSALRRGSLGFDDLRDTALSALNDIAQAALSAGLQQLGLPGGGFGGFGGGAAGAGGLGQFGLGLAGALLGLPGRATGGPVSPGRAFAVGENGPEVFVPTSSGNIVPLDRPQRSAMQLSITVNSRSDMRDSEALQRSSRQIARAVGSALRRNGG